MDDRVLQTQSWLNSTYGNNSSFVKVTEDGITGGNTVKALIRALQIELGVDVDGVFGDDTVNAFVALSTSSDSSITTISNQIYILQGGCYCKGYDPNGFDGVFSEGTSDAVVNLKSDAGLSSPSGIADAIFMKALLTTDGYVLSADGDSKIREIQQALNKNYSEYIGLIPCDGIFVKATLRGLISGLQVEQKKEYSNNVVDGIWGPTTMNRCPTLQRYGTVTNKQYVYLLQYALYANGYDPNGFDGGFGAGVQSAVKSFQSFVGLTSDGIVGKQTWASLLVSYGDQDRVGTACDCMTPLTQTTAQILVNNGRTAVGRYISGGTNKKLTLSELEIIYNAGLKVIPIYQWTNNRAEYFTVNKGARDAYWAYRYLIDLKFPESTIFYVAVDFDASVSDVEEYVLPYFREFKEKFDSINKKSYKIGIYGPRYVCTLIKNAGISESSFVCDMSSGFSCNIGYPLPSDWAFDQISTITLSENGNSIKIDNNLASGRDLGVTVDPNTTQELTQEEKYANRIGMTYDICSSYNLYPEIPAATFAFETEYHLVYGPPYDIYMSASTDVTTNSDATYSVNVTNGNLSDTTFSTELENVIASYQLSDVTSNFPDFASLALKMGSGKIEIKISVTTNTIELEIRSIILERDYNSIDTDFSVAIRFVWDLTSSKPDDVPETVWNKAKEFIAGLDWETVGEIIIVVCLIALLVYGIVSGTIVALLPAITGLIQYAV